MAREAGLFLRRKHGSVLPFGLTLDPTGDNPRTYFPRDHPPRASWDELLDTTLAHLERRIGAGGIGTGRSRSLGEPQTAEGLLVGPLLAGELSDNS
ncbi:hypothetical protein ACN28S_53770 [Cystobacter fuscus]